MEVIVTEKKQATKPEYPFVGKGTKTGIIVLFEKPGSGTVLQKGANFLGVDAGNIGTVWDMDCFEPFEGEITIRNN